MLEEKRVGSYPSIYAVGHKAILDIFKDEVLIEEKIDGSQFSFMSDGENLYCRSKGKQIVLDEPEKMFQLAVDTAMNLAHDLMTGWTYRCEYLQKPKHNTLAYDRVPGGNIILFDVMTGVEEYLSPVQKAAEAERLGLEVVPVIFQGKVENIEMFNEFLEHDSILGGTKIEGIVIKNYQLFTREKKVALAKYVSEKFKEKHTREWKKTNPSSSDVIQMLIATYRNEVRWEKAIQHLRDNGTLEGSPRDIGNLMKEVKADVLKECEDEIKDKLFKHFWPHISRALPAGLAEWYKQRLAESAFEEEQ